MVFCVPRLTPLARCATSPFRGGKGGTREKERRGLMRQSLLEYCTGSRFRPLLDEWDAARNLPLTPQSVTHGSHAQVWWRCAQGHSWRAAVCARTGSRSGCPVCAGTRQRPPPPQSPAPTPKKPNDPNQEPKREP